MLIKRLVRHVAIAAWVIGASLALLARQAEAALVFTVERQSDHTALVSVSGDWLNTAPIAVVLRGSTSTTGNAGADGFASGIKIGGLSSSSYFTVSGTTNFSIQGPFSAGTGTGSILATLSETWAAVGTTGKVFDRPSGGTEIGSYSIVAPVPIPGALPLLASGIAGLGWLRRRRLAA